jgi:phosphonate degradation associated HDIG domain protein
VCQAPDMLPRQHVIVMTQARSIAEVLALLRQVGAQRYDGEPVSHRDHALQSAALALGRGAGPALVVACLLHDVGHWLALDTGTPTLRGVDDRHEVAGPAWLAALFPAPVLQPIRWHVDAKRWLAANEPGYADTLSADSQRSLRLQGGPLSAAQADAFLARPYAQDALFLRRVDEAAKQPGVALPPLEQLARLMEGCCRGG